MDRNVLAKTTEQLQNAQQHNIAIIAQLARDFGLRFREASLLDAKQALKEAQQRNHINITAGTKGGRGREVDRWVPVNTKNFKTLMIAAELQQNNRNLIPESRNYKQWRDQAYNNWRKVIERSSIKGFHDLRAAYACERYQQITGHVAPVITGQCLAPKPQDQQARMILAQQLGHSRTDVMAKYLGSAK